MQGNSRALADWRRVEQLLTQVYFSPFSRGTKNPLFELVSF
jgi:hypothetical protein